MGRDGQPRSKGEVRPDPRVSISRLPVPGDVTALARHIWIPRWDLADGEVVTQPVLEYPGTNVVVEPAEDALYGPHRGLTSRTLSGRSWAVGVLLRPAAGTVMTGRVMADVAGYAVAVPRGEALVPAIREVMGDAVAGARSSSARDVASPDAEVVERVSRWLRQFHVDDEGLLINAIVDEVEADPKLTRVADIAARFDLGERQIQRVCRRRIGYSPKWLIGRRRLQEAAHVLRTQPDTDLADLAVDLGYSDQAHFAHDFAAVIGMPPGAYRAQRGE